MFRTMIVSASVTTSMCCSKKTVQWKASHQQIDAGVASTGEHQLFRDRRA